MNGKYRHSRAGSPALDGDRPAGPRPRTSKFAARIGESGRYFSICRHAWTRGGFPGVAGHV